MRPLTLVMRAFGAYAGEQRLDFRALGPDALFLIHGPTGAGKTTVLDAICFALYGETSGGERQGRHMRSDHADPASPTEVTLDFALGERAFRIRRGPEYERAARRGDGTTREPARATLWRLDGAPNGEAREVEVLARNPSEVSARVRDILGFDARQFRQVIVLPQGEFRRLLSADSRERETILATLFGTQALEALQRMLKEEAATVRREIERLRERRADLLAQAEFDGEAALAEREAALAEERASLAERLRLLRAEAEAARARLERGRVDATKLAELAEAEARLGELMARDDELRRDEERLAWARQAGALEPDRRLREDAARRRAEAAAEVTNAEGRNAAAATALAAASEARDAERAREAERAAAAAEVERLKALAARLPRVFEARDRLDEAERARTQAVEHQEKRRRERETLDRRRQGDLVALEGAREAAARVDGLARAAADLEQAVERRLALEQSRAALDQAAQAEAAANTRLDAKRREVAERRATLETLEAAWRRGQAGVLAAGLVEGEPCPVCGSQHHPAPAAPGPDVPSEDTLKAARAAVAGAEDERERLQGEATARHGRAAALQAEAAELERALGERAAVPPEALKADSARARTAHEEAAHAAAVLDEVRARVEAGDKRLRELAAEVDATGLALMNAEAEAAAARAALAAAVDGLPEELTGAATPGEADRRLATRAARARAAHEELVEGLRRTEEALSDAQKRASAEAGRLEAARRNARGAEEQAADARRHLEQRIAAAGFADTAAYEGARLDPEAIAALDAALRQARAERSRAEGRMAQAKAAAEGLASPDLEALEAEATARAAAADDATQREGQLAARAEQLRRCAETLAAVGRELEALEARYAVIGRVAEVANGAGEGAARITFQRFVLGALLDEVLDAASQRLRLMSHNRYLLRRAAPGGDRRRATGLDLEVDDAYTGKARPLATLSGGEGFLAALALALGLADVVQTRAGGVRLETLFIDEGFGALDPEALDLALRALVDLRRGGRLVGVISHVPELRERIDVRLEVHKAERGGTARFVLP